MRFCWLSVLALAAAACSRSAPPAAPPGQAASSTCVANSNSRIVHRSDPKYAAAMKPDHRIAFDHLLDAVAEGYWPCKSCLSGAAPTTTPAT
jgi:hypothetical protein